MRRCAVIQVRPVVTGRQGQEISLKDKTLSKEAPRARLEEDVEVFLKSGGKIEHIQNGVTGIKPKQSPMKKRAKK